MEFRNPLPDVVALARSGLIRPLAPRTVAAMAPRIAREGLRPHLIYALHAAETPDVAAIRYGGAVVTWRDLAERINRLANHLRTLGVGRGDAVAIALQNRPEFIETQAATMLLGGRAAFVNPRAPLPAVRSILERSAPAVVVTHRDDIETDVPVLRVGPAYEEALRAAPADEPKLDRQAEGTVVVFTSGTTGQPKGAVRSFSDASAMTLGALLRVVPFRRSDMHLVAAPLYHATGSGFTQIAHVLGNTLVLLEKFSAETFCELVERHRITTTALVPTMLHEIVTSDAARRRDLSSLRIVICTGSKLHEQTRDAARRVIGDVVYDLYGSTEMAWVSVATPADQRRRPGTVGKPVPGVRVRILDASGKERPRGEPGEIWASNPLVMKGYIGDRQLTDERLRDGAVSVRDVGYLDADGYLHIIDRSDDMLISGGVNVYPAETETVLMEHPAVAQVAVVGVADARWGQRVVAAVVAQGDVDEAALIAWCKQRLPAAAVPKQVRVFEMLRRNDVGKIDKRRIAAEWKD